MSEPDPLTVDLDTLPLQPQRWMYVLSLILRRHNWQHAIILAEVYDDAA